MISKLIKQFAKKWAKKTTSATVILWALCVPCLAQADTSGFAVEVSPVIVFTGARLIDGTGGVVKENQSVLVRNGRIAELGPDGSINIPEEARRIAMAGRSLLPGWVMHHEHLFYVSDHQKAMILTQQPISFPMLYLAAGVTSARTAGSIEPYVELNIKARIDAGQSAGPDFDLTAPYLQGGKGKFLQQHGLKSVKETRDMIDYWAKQGFTSVKAYTEISRAQLAAAIEEAHKRSLKITAHLCSVTYREAADLGIDQLEHGFIVSTDFYADKKPDSCPSFTDQINSLIATNPEGEEAQSLFRHLIENNVVITSTLEAYARAANMLPTLPDDVVGLFDNDSRGVYKNHVTNLGDKPTWLPRKAIETEMAMELAFWRAGGKLVVGTDPTGAGTLPGYGSLSAIELLVKAGIPPIRAIKIASYNGAEAMGVLHDRGSIAVGKRADLIIINGNPSVDINTIHNIDMVFKNGIGYDPVKLKESADASIGGPG